jgi:predicted O-methyltransferase YrrM
VLEDAKGSATPDVIVRDVLARAFPGKELRDQKAFTRAGMSPEELVRLYELAEAQNPAKALEVGMASGTSTVVILSALARTGTGGLTSIDPFQTTQFAGSGRERVRALGFADRHRLVEQPDYLALPQLLAAGESFDFILVDGYHSFDYTLVDVFYADLLLRTGGVLAVHDSSWPAVLKVLRFLEVHKDYRRLSPPPLVRRDGLINKALGRARIYSGGARRIKAFEDRRRNWHTLAAYRKMSERMAPEFTLGF